MKRREMMLSIALLFLMIFIPMSSKADGIQDFFTKNFLGAKASTNDLLAKAQLKNISVASEQYMLDKSGYPETIDDLTGAQPPYLNSSYCGKDISGFSYTCNFSKSGYEIVAAPDKPGVSGTTTFTETTGGIFTPST